MTDATHILQAKTEKLAAELWQMINGRCPISLIAFYGNEVRADGNAFVTTLDLNDLVYTLEVCVDRLGLDDPVELDLTAAKFWLPETPLLLELAGYCRESLPFAVSFVLLCGRGHGHRFASYLTRGEARKYLAEVFLPHAKARQVVTPAAQKETA